MSTEFFNDQWRIPSNENQNKVSNYSCEFDGTNTKIEFGDVNGFDRTDAFSGSCWVNLTGSDNEFILSKQDGSTFKGYMLYVNVDRYLILYIASSSTNRILIRTNSTVANNTWQHLVFTYDGSSTSAGVKLYFNGVNQSLTNLGNTSITGSLLDSSVPFQISGRDGTSANGINGQIDQVSVFDYELSATEVSTLYGGGTAITNPMTLSPKPISYYQLGDQSVDNGANLLVPNNSLSDYVFNFDGTNDYIDAGRGLGNSLGTYTGDASISLWFKSDNTTSNDGLFSITTALNSSDYGDLRINIASNTLYFVSNALVAWKYISFTDTTSWHHLVCVFKSGDITNSKIYLDGVDQVTTDVGTFPSSLSLTGKKTIIGAYYNATTNSFQGELSNAAIFTTELTSTQVETLYNNGSPANDISSLSPTAWYKLNAADTFDGTDWTINDYGSGGNDGTSSGMDSSSLTVSDLEQTNGFSPYALDLDGINDALTIQNSSTFNLGTAFTISGWFNFGSNKYQGLISFDATSGGSPRGWFLFQISSSNDIRLFDGANIFTLKTSYTTTNQWDSFIITYDGTDLVFYINGNQESTQAVSIDLQTNGNDAQIGNNQFASGRFFDGKISNIAFWNVGLTSTQVTEVFNEGVPSNLNTFSGTAPVSWWQLGSNSSYNSGAWTCLDEIGSNNAVSAGNMTNDDIVDGVGYSASGLGTSSIDIKGNAPYSTANGLSNSMDVLDRTTDVPS